LEEMAQTQPIMGSRAPAITAPNATPNVYPVFTRPIYRPLRFLPVNSRTNTIDTGSMPAAPAPVNARPTKKLDNVSEKAVRRVPQENIITEMQMILRGENI